MSEKVIIPAMSSIEASREDSKKDSARAERDRKIRNSVQIGTVALLAVGLVIGYINLKMTQYSHPDFSTKSKEIIAPSNDINDSINMIEYGGSGNPNVMTAHIMNDPRNQTILKDGLQAGDKITIPVSIEPLLP